MAEFLTTEGVSYGLTNIIREAREFIWLVSPFINPSDRLKERIDDTQQSGIRVSLIYGKKQRQRGKESWFTSRKWISTYYYEELHAKCYLNESKALITSMNLVEYSELNNREMGIVISLEKDPDLYNQILEEVESIKRAGLQISGPEERGKATDSSRKRAKTPSPISPLTESGFCIRCGNKVGTDPSKPFCKWHWGYWNNGIHNDYLQKYCDLCGKGDGVTRLKPACYSCYRKNKDKYKWPAA